jgi:hypothetical protein
MYIRLEFNNKTYRYRDSSVDTAIGIWDNDQGIAVRFPAGLRILSLLHSVQTDSEMHPASLHLVPRLRTDVELNFHSLGIWSWRAD